MKERLHEGREYGFLKPQIPLLGKYMFLVMLHVSKTNGGLTKLTHRELIKDPITKYYSLRT